MMDKPTVSVILPVYNCELYIYDAVQSILNQSFTNFELIIIDDCSTDATVAIINSFKDSRIRLIVKEKNSGYTDSLNYAITICKGDFIARMDGDDISLPERFQKQVDFLNANKDVIMCGTGIQIMDSDKILFHPSSHDDIKVKLCFSNAFFHPTVMFKKDALVEHNYDKNFEPAEDYDLWTRLIFKGKLSNIKEVLLQYRVHPNQISNYKNEIQQKASTISQLRMFQVLFDNQILDMELFKKAFKYKPTGEIPDLKSTLDFFNQIKFKNRLLKIYKEKNFESQLKIVRTNFLKKYITANGFSLKYSLSYLKYCNFSDLYEVIGITKRLKK